MSKSRRILLNTTLSLALGTTACMGHHPLFGCGLSLDPAHCNLVQGPVSIGNAMDPEDTVPDIRRGLLPGTTVKMSSFVVGIDGTILLRVNGQIQYRDEVHWHSSDKSVAPLERVLDARGVARALVVGKKVGIATISVNVSGQRDSVTVTVAPDSVRH